MCICLLQLHSLITVTEVMRIRSLVCEKLCNSVSSVISHWILLQTAPPTP